MANSLIASSATAASNTDVGVNSIAEGQAPSSLNNAIRQWIAYVVQRFGSSVSVASASTVALGDQEEQYVTISGTTTITSFGTPSVANKFGYWIKFDGALTLTHNGTSLILPGGANITTAAGDMAFCQHEGSGNWRVAYFPATGLPVGGTTATAGYVLTANGSGSAPTWQPRASLPTNYLTGLTLSNNVTDANNDIDVAVGKCRDIDDAQDMALAASITKRLDASWAVGTNQGGLDTGAKANSTWYHVYVIRRSDTGVVDVLFSTSASAPTMPTNYDGKRRIGAILTDGSGNIRAFVQTHDVFRFVTPVQDVAVTNLSTSRTLYTVSTPLGLSLQPILRCMTSNTSASIVLTSPDETDSAASTSPSAAPGYDLGASVYTANPTLITNTSSQIGARASAGSSSLYVNTRGWVDTRGK